MKVKLIIISIILLLVMVFASGCIPVLEKLGLVNPTGEEQLSPEKAGPPDGLVKVLIGFKEKPGPPEQALVKGLGGKIKYTYHIVDAIAASIPEKAIVALQKNPNVKYVEPDVEIFAVGQTLPWGVNRIDAEKVWTDYTGQGVKVAIIDSGIDKDHLDLKDNIIDGENFVSIPSWKTPDPDKWDDDYGHGTHVAGIVAALNNDIGVVGVAPKADLYALKVLGKTGRGNYSDVISAIEWCEDNDIRVTNNSYGSSGYPGETVEAAFDNAYCNYGIIHVAAAGNENGGDVIYPARFSSVIAVSATDEGDNLADFSSIGVEVELAAPGVDIYSTYKDGGYTTYSGTSMASPHVAGVAALVIAAGISDVRTQLQNTADDLGDSGRDSLYGCGLVNAAEAVSAEPVDVHDVAVTAISAPSWVLQGDMVSVDVDVANEGTFEETFNVVLTESPDGFSDTKNITLAVGVSTTISFSWQTLKLTDLGDHTLTATADLTTDEDTTDNSKFTIVTVVEAVTNMMYVESIEFDSKVAGPNKFLYTTVKVVDGDGSALEGVGVEMTLTYETSSWDFAGDTDIDGMVKFTQKKAPSGSYTATVTNLALTGYTWDATQGETSADYTL